jgi:hypothetical protein
VTQDIDLDIACLMDSYRVLKFLNGNLIGYGSYLFLRSNSKVISSIFFFFFVLKKKKRKKVSSNYSIKVGLLQLKLQYVLYWRNPMKKGSLITIKAPPVSAETTG